MSPFVPDFETVAFDVGCALDDGDIARACELLRRFPEHRDEIAEMIGDALIEAALRRLPA